MESTPDFSSLNGGLCPGPVLFTCMVTELPVLVWEKERAEFARYNPDRISAPLPLSVDIPGIEVNITSSMPVAEEGQCPGIPECDEFNVVSILATNTSIVFQNFNQMSIRCGSSHIRSNSVLVNYTLIGEMHSTCCLGRASISNKPHGLIAVKKSSWYQTEPCHSD